MVFIRQMEAGKGIRVVFDFVIKIPTTVFML